MKKLQRMEAAREYRQLKKDNEALQRKLDCIIKALKGTRTKKEKQRIEKKDDFIQFLHSKEEEKKEEEKNES